VRSREGHHDLDPNGVEILNELADCDFVLSSSWRSDGATAVQKRLDAAGFKGKLIDVTGHCRCRIRGVEVREWLNKNRGLSFDKYAIIDDDSDFLIWQMPHFFHVDHYAGITPNTVYKIRRFLKI
jgi:hypothetical protein